MSRVLRAITVLQICLPLCTQAHMQMSWPLPLRSPLDPAVPEQHKDYSMTNPLTSDGSNFPCKRYQYTDTNPQAYDIKATYQAGSSYNLTLVGGATHSGGSCQISLSYDNGATFKVIQSIIGGCPLAYTYDFTVPSFAPSSDTALLSWSWFNLVGNREMYQNCARVQIQGTPVQRHRRTAYRRQTSIDQLPDMFVCNVGNGCRTIENAEVVFPNPGPNVIYGQNAVTPQPGPGFIITGSSSTTPSYAYSTIAGFPTSSSAPFPFFNSSTTLGPTGTGSPTFTTTALTTANSSSTISTTTTEMTTSMTTTETITSTISMNSTTTTSIESITTSLSTTAQVGSPITITVTVTVTPTIANTPTTLLSEVLSTIVTTVSTSTSTSLIAPDTTLPLTTITTITVTANATATSDITSIPTFTPPPLPLPCTPGTFFCNTPFSFSQCITPGTSYIYMGAVAAGMQCVNGQIIRQNAGACTPNGQIFCRGGSAFYMCDQDGLVDMGPVAAGTVCRDGVIVAA